MGYRDMFNGWINAHPATSKAAALALLRKNAVVGRHRVLGRLRKPLTLGYFAYFLLTEAAAERWRPTDLVEADMMGFKLRLYPSEFLDCAMLRIPHDLDYVEVQYLAQHLKPDDVFLDIGSYVGFYSLFAARAVGPTGTVIAVEAAPETYKRMAETMAANGLNQVRPLNLAVSDEAGTVKFAVRPFPWRGSSTLWEKTTEGVEIPCKPLLDILREQGVTAVAGMKLDIEGYEYPVLTKFFQDAPEALWPRFVITEQLTGSADRAGGDAIDLLRQQGYRVAATNQANFIMERG